MGRKLARSVTAVTLSLSILLNAGLVQASDSQADIEQEVIVVYKNEKGKERVLDKSVEVQHEFDTIPAVSATVTNSDLRKLLTDPNIEYVERNISFRITGEDFKVTAVLPPGTPLEQSQWNFQAIQPAKMWRKGITGAGVKVAVIDSGIFAHNELSIAGGISTVEYTTSFNDDNGHGTHVAGIISAKNNNSGLVGIAPDVQLYAVKSMDQNGDGTLQDVLEGIEWAIVNEMDVINISLGTDEDSAALHEMVDRAYNAGIVVVGSAGNSQTDKNKVPIPTSTYTVNYPAKYDSVIAVAAVDEKNVRGVFSSVGPEVELAAPGVGVVSTFVKKDGTGSGYAIANGTSQAAPHVTGMIALLKQQRPLMTNKELREEVKRYAVDIGTPGRDTEFGFGSLTFNKDMEAPANVTNIHVTGKTENSISLSWTNPIDTDFAMNNIYVNDVKLGSTAEESFTLNKLLPNSPYTIAVKSVDAGGNESIGTAVTEITGAGAAAARTSLNLKM
ncbi:S8 family peptidase [Paenibacillus dakarensis]|uniref:S8 family peptidase n=1 Tax=Paenibacillus dakarensis TaxID=1527293 RepID=UPI0006D54A08|nr:S8 family serine peptidase [Paenibacillus dakarensis]